MVTREVQRTASTQANGKRGHETNTCLRSFKRCLLSVLEFQCRLRRQRLHFVESPPLFVHNGNYLTNWWAQAQAQPDPGHLSPERDLAGQRFASATRHAESNSESREKEQKRASAISSRTRKSELTPPHKWNLATSLPRRRRRRDHHAVARFARRGNLLLLLASDRRSP